MHPYKKERPHLRMIPVIIAFFFLILCLLPSSFARTLTTLKDESKDIALGLNLDLLEDSNGKLTIQQIITPLYSAQFQPSHEITPNLGYTNSIFWVRFTVKNLAFSDQWILHAAFSDMDNVELYIQHGANWQLKEIGDTLPFYSRDVVNRNLLFKLSLISGQEKTFYLRYQNKGGMAIPLKLLSFQRYQTFVQGEQLLFGIYYGFILVLAIYNLILFFEIKEWGYLFYFLYITGYGLFQLSLNGLAYQYLWPHWPWWANHNLAYFLAFAFFCRILFTMAVLDSKRQTPTLHKVLIGLLASLVLLIINYGLLGLDALPSSLVINSEVGLGLSIFYFVVFTLTILIISIKCWRNNFRPAQSFMIAWIFMVMGLIFYALKSFGFLPSNFLTEYGIQIGSAIEMCLLFISLGESIRAMKAEKEEEHLRQETAQRAYQEEQLHSMRLEMELLKANIQPHFMLNSLNAATMWLKEDPKTAEDLLHALSDELRQLLKIVGEKAIPFAEEIRLCQVHLKLMSLRQDKSFTMELDGIKNDELFPPMVIHTLMENGLTHGYMNKDQGVFILSRKEDEEHIYYSLFNDGDINLKNIKTTGLGLKYVRSRLEEAYPGQWELHSDSVEGGWMVSIKVEKNKNRITNESKSVDTVSFESSQSA